MYFPGCYSDVHLYSHNGVHRAIPKRLQVILSIGAKILLLSRRHRIVFRDKAS
jgi:hypothetical protein